MLSCHASPSYPTVNAPKLLNLAFSALLTLNANTFAAGVEMVTPVPIETPPPTNTKLDLVEFHVNDLSPSLPP